MTIKKITATLWVAALAVSIMGCEELTDLDVVNENAPDKDRALDTPGDVEALIGGAGASWWLAIQGLDPITEEAAWGAIISTIGDESSLSWGNWGIRDMSSEPRIAWNNSSTYASELNLSFMYRGLYGTLSAVRDGIIAINDGLVIEDAATTARALAFAKLMQGLGHGYLALFIDQGNILNEATELQVAGVPVTLEFATYQEMMAEAITNLNASIAISDVNTFTTPTTWFNGITLTSDELSQLAHSFNARFMANVARTPAERDAVAWGTVKTEITAGITSDFSPVGDEKNGGGPWFDTVKWMMNDASTWTRADYRSIGGVRPNDPETDISGGYANWLNTPVPDRDQYNLNTLDKRLQAAPGNDALDADGDPIPANVGLDFSFAGVSPHLSNRGTYHWSMYIPTRYPHRPVGSGPMTFMTVTEMNLLMAEAHLRLGEGGAAALINLTRVNRGGLTAATDGGPDEFERLYYEKFIEQFGIASGLAWTERRGAKEIAVASSTAGMTLYGPVPGTLRHFPVPGKELEVLQLPLYTFGGSGAELAPGAAGARYGAPATAVYKFNPAWSAAEKLRHLLNMGKRSRGLPSYR